MDSKETFLKIIWQIFEKDGYDEKHKQRLELELKEIDDQSRYDYFLDIFKAKEKRSYNKNNLFVAKLLRVTDAFNIDQPAKYGYGDLPDIDCDYLPLIRDYVKNEWAPKAFGEQNVCNIGNYSTFGIKNALIDMARVHGYDRNEILGLTTKLGIKDDDGKPLTWEKALELNEDLARYCKEHPDVARSAKNIINRNRGKGKHAGGLIISSSRIDNLVPLVTDPDGNPVSAWVEGLHDQDLQPVGLVKFDCLSIINLMQIAICCDIVKKRHNLTSICSLPDLDEDWSDTSFLNDPKAIEMANRGELKCIFQFDSETVRKMAQRGGVDTFDDLVAYTSLNRPSAMQMGMHDRYINRKKRLEDYSIHPVLQPILGKTYGVMVFQESVIKILNVVGGIPEKDCEIVRKAISKKKEEIFARYKDMFLQNGQVKLGWTLEQVSDLWDQVVAFSGYGFNLCLTGDTLIFNKLTNEFISLEQASEYLDEIVLDCLDGDEIVEGEVDDVFFVKEEDVYEVILENGQVIKGTLEHRFICSDGQPHTLQEIIEKDLELVYTDDIYTYAQHSER